MHCMELWGTHNGATRPGLNARGLTRRVRSNAIRDSQGLKDSGIRLLPHEFVDEVFVDECCSGAGRRSDVGHNDGG